MLLNYFGCGQGYLGEKTKQLETVRRQCEWIMVRGRKRAMQKRTQKFRGKGLIVKKWTFLPAVVIALSLSLLSGCAKKTLEPFTESLDIKEISSGSFSWFAFNQDNFIRIPKIQSAPTVLQKPWTEAIRIATMALQKPTASETPKAYAVVNRLGMIEFSDDKANLYVDINLFSTRTAVGLVFIDKTPVFSMFKNSLFNESVNSDSPFLSISKKAIDNYQEKDAAANIYDYTSSKNNPFLVQFDLEQHICFPIVNTNNIALNNMGSPYQITDFSFDGDKFFCSAKKVDEKKDRVQFAYFTLIPKIPLLTITPETAEKSISIESIEQGVYRASFQYNDFNTAPQRLKDLLSSLPETASFSLDLYTAGGPSPRHYVAGGGGNSSLVSFRGTAQLCDTYVAVMFLDGTLFFKGSLYDGHLLNGGRTFAIRLPKLPAGFVYSSFIITGRTLYAAWEENYFYKSARSGFIKVNLSDVIK